MNIQTMNKYEKIINKNLTIDEVFTNARIAKKRNYGMDTCNFKIGCGEWDTMPLVRDEDGDLKIPSDSDILDEISKRGIMTAWDFVWEYYTESEIEDLIEQFVG